MKTQQMMWAAVLLSGCSGTVNVGPSLGAGGAAGSSGMTGVGGASAASSFDGPACTSTIPLPSWPDSNDCVEDSTLPLVGTWNGYLENGKAPWDHITLAIKGRSAAGNVCGTVTFGSGTPPPPATDPDVGYPPRQVEYGTAPDFINGYPLTMLQGTFDGTRLQFQYADTESRRSWCLLQNSFGSIADPADCHCLPLSSSGVEINPVPADCRLFLGANDKIGQPVDCDKANYCVGRAHDLCVCNATGCDSAMNRKESFDLRFAADTAEGSASANAGAGRLHFSRP